MQSKWKIKWVLGLYVLVYRVEGLRLSGFRASLLSICNGLGFKVPGSYTFRLTSLGLTL